MKLFSGNVDDTRENEDRLCADVISSKCPRLSDIIDMLVKSLSDEVSTCLRQSCAAVGICADALLRSKVSGSKSIFATLLLPKSEPRLI